MRSDVQHSAESMSQTLGPVCDFVSAEVHLTLAVHDGHLVRHSRLTPSSDSIFRWTTHKDSLPVVRGKLQSRVDSFSEIEGNPCFRSS